MIHNYFERELPPQLSDLVDLALDLRWNNCPAARHLWSRFHPEIWSRTENPVLVLQSAYQAQIDAAATDAELLEELQEWRNEVREYYGAEPEFRILDPDHTLKTIAYFSMEFGLSESLPIFSGGLGMLAGDHLKTASDLGVPMVAVGLLYQQGYFRQVISDDGNQLEAYPFNDPGSLPVKPLTDADGQWVRIRLPFPGRTLYVRVWEARVGRVRLFLLDSNDAMNTAWDRGITAQLYDSGPEKRLLQEIVLGVGGWRLIERLKIDADVCHLNEGHAAFATLARAAAYSKKHDLPLRVAFAATRAGNVFTTHTPVEAAFDRFEPTQLEVYSKPFLDEVGFSIDELLAMGRKNPDDDAEPFNMALLALRGSCHVNAVSRLHGQVSRELFSSLFPRWPGPEIPVQAITNGIHVPTWASRRAGLLWGEDQEGGHLWLDGLDNVAQRIEQTPAEKIWSFRTQQRRQLLKYVSARYAAQVARANDGRSKEVASDLFDPNVLTIGFARRFATYKRANLLLTDRERLRKLLTNDVRPIQLIVAGKAHPNDGYGKTLVKQLNQFFNEPDIRRRAIFLEDYDMVLGQHLVAGVDVWLNTPLRPNEACGTSGMKLLVNGGLNLSVLDGWWDEVTPWDDGDSINPGWVVGSREPGTVDEVNARDAESLYDLLENVVVPEFYDLGEDGIPRRWINRVKASMTRLTPQFSATRMLHEYIAKAYLPAAKAYRDRTADHATLATEILSWKDDLMKHWDHIRVGKMRLGEQSDGGVEVSVECWLDSVSPEFLRVQLYAEPRSPADESDCITLLQSHALPGSVNGYVFQGRIPADRPVNDYSVRIVPYHREAYIPMEQHCIYWNR